MLEQGSPLAGLRPVGRRAAAQFVAAVTVAVQGGPAKAGHRFGATIPIEQEDVFHAASLRAAVGQALSEGKEFASLVGWRPLIAEPAPYLPRGLALTGRRHSWSARSQLPMVRRVHGDVFRGLDQQSLYVGHEGLHIRFRRVPSAHEAAAALANERVKLPARLAECDD